MHSSFNPLPHIRYRSIRRATEAQQNCFNYRRMIEGLGKYRPSCHPGRDYDCRHSTSEGIEIRVSRSRLWHDVVKESAMFIVRNDQKSLVPGWTCNQRIVKLECECLPGLYIGRWMIIICVGFTGSKIDKVRVDPRNGGEVSAPSMIDKTNGVENCSIVEIKKVRSMTNTIIAIDKSERRNIVTVPSPTNIRRVKVTDKRLPIIYRHCLLVCIATRATRESIEAVWPGLPRH